WPWADTWPVARLKAPAHGVDLIVLAGVSGRTLAFGHGHAAGTALPVDDGIAVVTGHRDTHFAFLSRVRAGDMLVLEVPGRAPVVFRVSETAVVDARTAAVGRDDTGSALVLLTCYPFDAVTAGGPLRYVVMAEREGTLNHLAAPLIPARRRGGVRRGDRRRWLPVLGLAAASVPRAAAV